MTKKKNCNRIWFVKTIILINNKDKKINIFENIKSLFIEKAKESYHQYLVKSGQNGSSEIEDIAGVIMGDAGELERSPIQDFEIVIRSNLSNKYPVIEKYENIKKIIKSSEKESNFKGNILLRFVISHILEKLGDEIKFPIKDYINFSDKSKSIIESKAFPEIVTYYDGCRRLVEANFQIGDISFSYFKKINSASSLNELPTRIDINYSSTEEQFKIIALQDKVCLFTLGNTAKLLYNNEDNKIMEIPLEEFESFSKEISDVDVDFIEKFMRRFER